LPGTGERANGQPLRLATPFPSVSSTL
jgi:hypothetical protein